MHSKSNGEWKGIIEIHGMRTFSVLNNTFSIARMAISIIVDSIYFKILSNRGRLILDLLSYTFSYVV